MKYRDGMPIEWRVTVFYVCAATALTVAIIAADYKTDSIIAIKMDALKAEIAALKGDQCE